MIVGVDTGGTFTDFIFFDGQYFKILKRPSTPLDPSQAIIDGIKNILIDIQPIIVHGSTVGTNLLLEKKGANTALITNKGIEDVIEIGRQDRSHIYNLSYIPSKCLIDKKNRFGILGRISSKGTLETALEENDVEHLINTLIKNKVESIAVCLLFSFLNSNHEIQVYEILKKLNIPISLSHLILAEFREYERTQTTVINAYIAPKMIQYINTLGKKLKFKKLRIMQSNGGSISAETAINEPVRTILSGPAGGVMGAYYIGKRKGVSRLISFDMGGTSTDVSLIDQEPLITTEAQIDGYPIKVPMLDIHTVGAGGGSIVKLDTVGGLKVGPQSAGADPGPVCYGKGDALTITDANLFLGRLLPQYFLGGEKKIHDDLVKKRMEALSDQLGLSVYETADGIISIANAIMERAIKKISVEKGFDIRSFSLISFGGAGGLHAALMARSLNMKQVIIPPNPGVLSAYGMLCADVIKDYSQTIMKAETEINFNTICEKFHTLSFKSENDLLQEGFAASKIQLAQYVDMRYQGQSYELLIPFSENFISDFHKFHKKRYGYCDSERSIEIVNIRIRAFGKTPKFNLSIGNNSQSIIDFEPIDIFFNHRFYETMVFHRAQLKKNTSIIGPAIVLEYSSTIFIPPGFEGVVDNYENICIQY